MKITRHDRKSLVVWLLACLSKATKGNAKVYFCACNQPGPQIGKQTVHIKPSRAEQHREKEGEKGRVEPDHDHVHALLVAVAAAGAG